MKFLKHQWNFVQFAPITSWCLYCRKNRNFSEKCGISWDNCGHAFHTHCLIKAQNKSKVFPLDKKKSGKMIKTIC